MWIIFYIGAMALPLYMLNTSLHTRVWWATKHFLLCRLSMFYAIDFFLYSLICSCSPPPWHAPSTNPQLQRVLIDHLHYMALVSRQLFASCMFCDYYRALIICQVIWLTGVFIYQMGFMFFNGKWTYNHQSYFYPYVLEGSFCRLECYDVCLIFCFMLSFFGRVRPFSIYIGVVVLCTYSCCTLSTSTCLFLFLFLTGYPPTERITTLPPRWHAPTMGRWQCCSPSFPWAACTPSGYWQPSWMWSQMTHMN